MALTSVGRCGRARGGIVRWVGVVMLGVVAAAAPGCSGGGPGQEIGGAAGEVAGSAAGGETIKPKDVGSDIGGGVGRVVGEAVGAKADD